MSIDWARDEIILACDLVRANGWKGLNSTHPSVVELSQLLNVSPLHPNEKRDTKFRNPNGVARKTWDIATQHPSYEGKRTKGNKIDGIVLQDFLDDPERMQRVAAEIRRLIISDEISSANFAEAEPDTSDVQEGRLLVVRHMRRERSPRLREEKIKQAERRRIPIACEVCSFDFKAKYGARGARYIEVHHVLPLHVSGERRTKLDDLAMLCANCHRMIHRGKRWLTPDDLKSLIQRTTTETGQ